MHRTNLTNLTNVIFTIIIIAFVIYLEGCKVNIPIKHKHKNNFDGRYPIKLLYTSSTPVMLYSALSSNLNFLSQSMYKKFPNNMFINLFGTWDVNGRPTDGFIYYISAPMDISDILINKLRLLGYLVFILFTCAIFSHSWMEISGSSVKDVANMLKKEDMTIRGFRETSVRKELNRYIPIAATLGGICIGLLTVVSEITGVIGSGSGVLITVSTILNHYESIQKDVNTKLHIF